MLPQAGSWDVPPLYGHVDDGRFVLGWQVLDDQWPVSYTHLRAHATVLDLVCRLLLEKKTIRNDTIPSTLSYRFPTTNVHIPV